MNKKEAINSLTTDPKFDGDWIENAATLIESRGMNAAQLMEYSGEQLKIISMFLGDDEDINALILNSKLNKTQMQILLTAHIKNNVKYEWLKILANPSITYTKMNYLAQGMVDGFNMYDIIPNLDLYDNDQFYELYAGIKCKINYTMYARPELPARIMGIARHALQLGMYIDAIDRDRVSCSIPKK